MGVITRTISGCKYWQANHRSQYGTAFSINVYGEEKAKIKATAEYLKMVRDSGDELRNNRKKISKETLSKVHPDKILPTGLTVYWAASTGGDYCVPRITVCIVSDDGIQIRKNIGILRRGIQATAKTCLSLLTFYGYAKGIVLNDLIACIKKEISRTANSHKFNTRNIHDWEATSNI